MKTKFNLRRTKIIATIGPATCSQEKIKSLIKKGLNIIRLNFSHGTGEEHLKTIKKIRKISSSLNKSIAIIGDLCGPKIRVGKFKNNSIILKTKSIVSITTKKIVGHENLIPSLYKDLITDIKIGERIFLDDGSLELKVTKKLNDIIEAKVIRGGILKNNKGMNLPDTNLKTSSFTIKDKRDVKYCIQGSVDYIALSFVRTDKDIINLKKYLKRNNSNIPVIAKIEKPEALNNINKIIEISDGIMIARGDLGVELPPQKVPMIQNKLIELSDKLNKPVIVATQMLESMIENSRPTRAEVTDVSSACLSGADAVMLSGETAVGKYPIETFKMMDSILQEAEKHQFEYGGFSMERLDKNENLLQNSLATATSQISRDLNINCIAALTRSGTTARIISSDRPNAPIIALSQSEKVVRQMNLLWGVTPFLIDREFHFYEFVNYTENIVKQFKLAKKNDFLIILSGLADNSPATNSIVVHQIAE